MYISPTGDYPRYPGDIQIENPSWSSGDLLPSGWIAVTPTEQPACEDSEVVEEQYPVEVNGEWIQTWAVRALTEQELQIKNAPQTVVAKLEALNFTTAEIALLLRR
jgi:hypothetical protein